MVEIATLGRTSLAGVNIPPSLALTQSMDQLVSLRKRGRTGVQMADANTADVRAGSVGQRLGAGLRGWMQRLAGGKSSSHRARRRAELRMLKESGLFDVEWYLATYPDVASAKLDPAVHYIENGWREGRNPSPAFCTSYYLRRHADVAELGVNPLIHFIEHGSFEGREIEGTGDLPWSGRTPERPPTNMPPPVPVYQPDLSTRPAIPWLRACNIATGTDPIMVDGLGLATVASTKDRSTIASMLDDFVAISGGEGAVSANLQCYGTFPDMVDAWFSSSHRLQSRWKVAAPTVIRALQLDPDTGKLVLVGEGLAVTPLDAIHFDLASPVLPLLFLASGCLGELQGVVGLIFPSLVRGGIHYQELIDASLDNHRVDPVGVSRQFEAQLRKLRSGKARPAVRELIVELSGADGTGPLFNRDVRYLLQRVLAVGIRPAEHVSSSQGMEYLADAAHLTVKEPVRHDGCKLRLAADMLPTIRILLAEQVRDEDSEGGNVAGLIVRDPDPAQPAVRFDFPAEMAPGTGNHSNDFPLPFPLLDSLQGPCAPAAIRTATRALDDAEFLFPDLSAVPDLQVAKLTLDWLIDWSEADQGLLAQSLTALSFQKGIGAQRLCFLSRPSTLALEVSEAAFRGRWEIFDGSSWTATERDSDLTAHLGPGVVLHDPRTAAMLATCLLDPNVSTSSCALISSTRHGRSWRPVPVDPGVIPTDCHVVFGGKMSSPVEMLWRSAYPIAKPPAQLWMARTADIGRGNAERPLRSRLNMLTSRITASLEKTATDHAPQSANFFTSSSQSEFVRAKVLVG